MGHFRVGGFLMCDSAACQHAKLDRRALLAMGLSGAATLAAGPILASGKAKAIMLSCMDFRLVDDLVGFMEAQGLHDEYDHVVLAGAALGAIHQQFAEWHKVFWDHVGLAVKLHHVEEIIVIDHRDCGAYKLALGASSIDTPEQETQTHSIIISAFKQLAASRFPELAVRGYLMALDGTVEEIGVQS